MHDFNLAHSRQYVRGYRRAPVYPRSVTGWLQYLDNLSTELLQSMAQFDEKVIPALDAMSAVEAADGPLQWLLKAEASTARVVAAMPALLEKLRRVKARVDSELNGTAPQ